MNENYLPLAYLNAWEYCPRRFYIEYELGEMADNEYIVQGRHIHRNVDNEGTHQEENTITHRHQWVWSDRLKVNGIIDAVEEKEGVLIPLEYKKGRQGKHLNDHFQLCAAALCIEERTNKTISYGEIFYYGNRRRQKVEFTSQLRQMTENAIAQCLALSESASAHITTQGKMPPPINNAKKCQACSLKNICLPQEIRYLLKEKVL
jgi:CRISPR-associated exonuclease Cas4